MKNIAQLVDDLLAFRRGEIAFDAVTDHVSTHLVKAPHAAEDVLKQIDRAFDSKLLEPSQVVHLKTIVADTIAPHNAQLTQRIRVDISSVQGGGFSVSNVQGGGGARRGPAQPVSRSNIPLGTRLRERFVLDEVLGAGGMGTVYKGRDLLKVEARDRNPYVAIKVLNDDFRKRDDAFIVLQREASRQQRLAHPNVATVYDFDRTGDTFFISMELLEGTPLDSFMADSRGRGGVSWEEAQKLIEGMGAALTYAHEHGIVHADFKPSNCFLMKDGKVKVLDFGIARAIKRPNQAPSDVTVYDGASIGALTPAYASSEMLEGNSDPDPTDDVYGFACVCYELLSGKHPYNRMSAREARYQKLVPKRIDGLTSRQNRALQKALAFDRTERTQTVRDFVLDLEAGSAAQSLWNRKRIAIAAVIILIIGGAIAWYRIEYPIMRTIADIRSDNSQTAQAAIDRLAVLSPADRARVIDGARGEITGHYQKQVRRMLDTGEIDAAYAKAEEMLAAGLQIDPKAQPLLQLRGEVARRKDRFLSELAEQYETYLAAGRLLKSREHGDIQGVMQRIRLVDPKHPLLTDPRVPGAFANAADTAINNGKLDEARALLTDALEIAPKNRALLDVNDKLASADRQARLRQRSGELVAQINSQLGTNPTLEQIAATTPALVELREIDSDHAALQRAAAAARSALGSNYDAITNLATVDDVVAFERRYEPTFEALSLSEASSRTAARRQALETRRDRLLSDARTLAANPSAKSAASLDEALRQVRAIAPADPQIGSIVTSAISELRRESQRLSGAGQWKEARSVLTAAIALDGSPAVRTQIDQDLARIGQREQDSIQQTLAAEREAAQTAERQRIEAAETQLRTALSNFSPTANGLTALEARIAALSALDPGNATIQSARNTAAQRIATAANDAAKAGQFAAALSLLARASVDLPGAPEIAKARTQVETMQADATKQAQQNAFVAAQQAFRTLLDRPTTTDARWQRDAEAAIAAIRKVATNDAAVEAARGQLANAYLSSADQLLAEKRFTIADQMLDKAEQLTPHAAGLQTRREQWARAIERDKNERAVAEATAKVDAAKQRFANEIKSNQLDRARRTLTELQTIAGNDAFVTREAPAMLSGGYLSLAQARLKAGDIGGAWRLAAAGSTITRDDSRYAQLRADIDANANRRVEALLSARGTVDGTELAALTKTYRTNAPDGYETHKPTWTGRVKDQLAGLTADPTAHNTYLLVVQGAFEDVAAIQSIRPLAARAPAPAPTPVATPTVTPPVATAQTNGTPNGNASNATPVSQSPAPTRPIATPNQAPQPTTTQQAPAPVFEPSLTGKWCGDGGLAMTFASNEYAFDLGGGRVVKYPVERYQRAGNTITMTWSDKTLGSMITEFGDFSNDGQGMVQLRGKKADAAQWQNYNRKFKKCN